VSREESFTARDPRDVLLSYHRFCRHVTNYQGGLKDFAMDWVSGRIWPCSWQAHVNSWLGPRHKPTSFELTSFRYEDLISDRISHTESLAKILGADVSRARIEEIVADTTPGAMRAR
jgi:Sulfotransferase domain